MSRKKSNFISIEKLDYEDSAPIFSYINPNENEIFSSLSGNDLQDLIALMDDYLIQLRERLGFSNGITFGLEMEFENALRDFIEEELVQSQGSISTKNWTVKSDVSLTDGAEINSPVLIDNNASWRDLYVVCSIVQKYAMIGKHSGGHIHIGTQTLGANKDSWLNFIRLWSAYENIIFRFLYGDYLTARPSLLHYAEPMTRDFWRYYEFSKDDENIYELGSILERRRNQAINFGNVAWHNLNKYSFKNTIEFRCPNGTLNPAIWQNNINFLVKLLMYSKGTSFDDKKVLERHQSNFGRFDMLQMYDEVYIDQALELCDMIFDNNFDKVYFLKQYLKSLEVREGLSEYPRAKELTIKGVKALKK